MSLTQVIISGARFEDTLKFPAKGTTSEDELLDHLLEFDDEIVPF
jgi:hypothetical protein